MPSLAQQHCLNHPAREAAVQCPQCRHFFCRECVTEHDDRLLCAVCLRKESRQTGARRRPFRALARAVLAMGGLLTATLFFYGIAQALLLIPAAWHDGTLWKSFWSSVQ
jgi:hypothetical protein